MKTNKSLQFHYYGLYVVLLILLAVAHFSMNGLPFLIVADSVSMMISTINILFLLAIPMVFKLFSIKVGENATIQTYAKWALVQMYAIAFPAITSVATYWLLREKTALYCYLIAFIALIFCKPTVQKWNYYLSNQAVTQNQKEDTHE
jgi:hypothetical protein